MCTVLTRNRKTHMALLCICISLLAQKLLAVFSHARQRKRMEKALLLLNYNVAICLLGNWKHASMNLPLDAPCAWICYRVVQLHQSSFLTEKKKYLVLLCFDFLIAFWNSLLLNELSWSAQTCFMFLSFNFLIYFGTLFSYVILYIRNFP